MWPFCKLISKVLELITKRRQRKEEIQMYKQLNECLLGVARSMDNFGDVLVENCEGKNMKSELEVEKKC